MNDYKEFYEGKELKNCPFCDHKASAYIQDWDHDRSLELHISCGNCGAKMSNVVAPGKSPLTHEAVDKAIADWNYRNMEIKLNEVEVQKLNLQPGEVLVVKVKSDNVSSEGMRALGESFRQRFPNNKVAVLGMAENEDISLTVAKGSDYPGSDACANCNCGKKD